MKQIVNDYIRNEEEKPLLLTGDSLLILQQIPDNRGKKILRIHYYKNGNALPNPPDLKKGDPLYEKHKRLFKGGK